MNILIITAHPATWGFAHKIAERYQAEKESRGHNTQVLDLYQDKAQVFLPFEAIQDLVTTDEQQYYQDKISWADELVFVYPIWWGAMPAIMKNWIDWNFASGFAFRFTAEGKQEKLLTGKTARVFATGDGPRFMYWLVRPMMSMLIGQGILGFCGIKQLSFDLFPEMVKNKNDAARERMLAQVSKRAG